MTDDAKLRDAIELMDRGWRARREEKYAEAYKDLREAIGQLREARAHDELVTALGRLGHVEMDQGRYDIARGIYEEAIGICREAGDSLALAHKIRHLGDVHRHSGRQDDARACYRQALALYRVHQEPPTLDYANAVRMVALVEEDLGHIDQAKQLWAEARDLYADINLQEGVDECSERLAGLNG